MNKQTIKHIHAIWLGDKISPLALCCLDDWDKQGYAYTLWTEKNPKITEWINECRFARECYSRGLFAFVTDYLRLKVLSEEGGLYLDTDVTIHQDPFYLFDNCEFCVGQENEKQIGNAIIYARAESKILSELILFYEEMIMQSPLYMGPEIVTKQIITTQHSHRILEQSFFYGYSGDGKSFKRNADCHLIHWYQHTWKRNRGLAFIKSKHKNIFWFMYEYQKELFRLRK